MGEEVRVATAAKFLDHLPQKEMIEEIQQLGTLRQWSPGDVLARQGDDVDRVFVPWRGSVKVTATSEDGSAVLVLLFGVHDLIGAASSMFRPPKWRHTVNAAERLWAFAIPLERFQRFAWVNPELLWALNRYVARLLQMSDQKLLDARTLDARGRVRRLLLDLAMRFGRPDPTRRAGSAVEIGVPLSQAELASLAGVSEASMYRELAFLRKSGLVQVGYRTVTILNYKGLTALEPSSRT